jgi:hypothetical protein
MALSEQHTEQTIEVRQITDVHANHQAVARALFIRRA